MCGPEPDRGPAHSDTSVENSSGNNSSPTPFRKKGRNWQGVWRKTPGRLLGIGVIKIYQFLLSPIIGRSCRHLPTCSEFGYEAIARHGLIPGGWLTFWRVLKCNPFGTSGIDPVPTKMRWFKN